MPDPVDLHWTSRDMDYDYILLFLIRIVSTCIIKRCFLCIVIFQHYILSHNNICSIITTDRSVTHNYHFCLQYMLRSYLLKQITLTVQVYVTIHFSVMVWLRHFSVLIANELLLRRLHILYNILCMFYEVNYVIFLIIVLILYQRHWHCLIHLGEVNWSLPVHININIDLLYARCTILVQLPFATSVYYTYASMFLLLLCVSNNILKYLFRQFNSLVCKYVIVFIIR